LTRARGTDERTHLHQSETHPAATAPGRRRRHDRRDSAAAAALSASAAAPQGGQRIDMKVLLLATTPSDPDITITVKLANGKARVLKRTMKL
jgi:hypothetical protein